MTSVAIQAETETRQFRGYPVHLDRFEGPLDLLLDLIKRNKEDIWDISITRITRQYLDYISTLQALEIEVAGEYLVMAATLMRVKSQMLLPRPSFVPLDEEDDAPLTREGLIAKLIEYRRIKEAAKDLQRREGEQGRRFVRGTPEVLEKGYQLPLRDPRLIDLVRAFREVLGRDKEELRHVVELEEVDLEDQMEWIRVGLSGGVEFEPLPDGSGTGLRFSRLIRNEGVVVEVVVTLLAVLELSKAQRVRSWQCEAFDEIWLTPGDAGVGVDPNDPIDYDTYDGPDVDDDGGDRAAEEDRPRSASAHALSRLGDDASGSPADEGPSAQEPIVAEEQG